MIHELSGDRPLSEDGVDLLGFAPLADRLADSILSRSLADGIVIGLEGKWGSGKSSLMNLMLRALRHHPRKKPAIVQFRPWLVGNRDALLKILFGDLAKAVDEIQLQSGNATRTTISSAKEIAEKVRRFGARLGGLAPAASLAGWVVPGAEAVAKILESVEKAAGAEKTDPPLSETKDELSKLLAGLPERIVVTIDDVDRLEPEEVQEILRLVRSVADFENVVYVLCYDPDILAEAIKEAIGVADGHAYLEKIVQITASVPAPETFQLRRMFQDGLAAILGTVNEETASRITAVVRGEGAHWLKTPRAVARTLDSLRFVLPVLGKQVDLADLVWLHLVKVGSADLYRWVESYLTTMAALSSGRLGVNDEAARAHLSELEKILSNQGRTFEDAKWELGEVLPGFALSTFDDKKAPIYRRVESEDRLRGIANRALSSPDHYRLYFTLALPAGAPSESDFLRLWEAASRSVADVETLLLDWFSVGAVGVGSKAEIMLDRLRSIPADILDRRRSEAILLALANVLDETPVRERLDEWGTPSAWTEAERLLPILKERLGGSAHEAIVEVFRHGRAFGWLNGIFRTEVFSHGLYGDRRKPEELRFLTPAEFGEVVSVMQERYQKLTLRGVLNQARPLSVLFGWHQSGGGGKPRALVQKGLRRDSDLLRVLDGLGGRVRTSGKGVSTVLKREDLEPFLDFDEVRQRVASLAKHTDNLGALAKQIEARFVEGDDF